MMSEGIGALAVLGIWATLFAGWLTHIFWFFGLVTGDGAGWGQVLFFIFALLAAPIGCIHGIWLWFQ